MSAAATAARQSEKRMGSTYRAAVVHGFQVPLTLEQVPDPELTADQVRVEIEACGLCHTDIHAVHGDWPVKPQPPFIPGHEAVGHVVEVGSAVTAVTLGQRVAMPWLGYACGTCDYCVSGWETLPLTCAGVTTYKAVKVAGTRSSDLVAVFGVGGLGRLAIQYAKIAGGRVVAIDLTEEKLELARELGAEFTVNATREDPIAAIKALGGADQAKAPMSSASRCGVKVAAA